MKKVNRFSIVKTIFTIGIIGIIQGCSLNIPIDNPSVSELPYTQHNNSGTVQLKLEDSLSDAHQISHGRIKINLLSNERPLETVPFVFASLKKELESRGLPIEYSDSALTIVELHGFDILNHRVSGFSPMVTISTLKAELKTEGGSKRISAMVKRGKVPVWTMAEINDPCYNEPIELLIKELAAKINKEVFGFALNDNQVDRLVAKINSEANESRLSYFDVYELGFSNNPKAIEPLKEFTKHGSDYVRMAAISSLGILGAEEFFDGLKSIYRTGNLWQDRGMALKAIGDLGSEQALMFLKEEKNKWASLDSNEAKWNTMIIGLYVN